MAIAPIVSPLLGGLIEHYIGWRANFWISGGITLAVMLVLMQRMPETYTPGLNSGPLLSGMMTSLRSRSTRASSRSTLNASSSPAASSAR